MRGVALHRGHLREKPATGQEKVYAFVGGASGLVVLDDYGQVDTVFNSCPFQW